MWYLAPSMWIWKGIVLVRECLAKLCKQLFKEFYCKVAMVIVKIGSNARLTDKIRYNMLEVIFHYCPTTNANSLLLAFNMPYKDAFLDHVGLQFVVLTKDNEGAENDQHRLATMFVDHTFCQHPCEPCVVVKVAIWFV